MMKKNFFVLYFTSVSNTSIASNVIRIREGGSGGKERD